MQRMLSWCIAWLLTLIWCLALRPFVPGFLPIEPFVPLLVASLMLGPLRLVVPLILLGGVLFDAFQPFPEPTAFFVVLGITLLIGLAVRFVLASRSFYSALVLVVLARCLIAGLLYLLGPSVAVWSADRAMLQSPLFFGLTLVTDILFLLICFRLVARPLLGTRRVQIVR